MPDLDLAELRALTAAALPAPWTLTRGHDGWDLGAGPHGIVTTGAGMRAQDAALIAAARNALPALLDRIKKLEDSAGTVWAEMNDALNERDDRFAKLERVVEAARQVDAAFYKFGDTPPPLIGLNDALAALDAADD